MMEKHYDAKAAEAKWYPLWEKNGHFHQEPDGREPYSVVIPPPNVTGILHMGHALNQTIQDILVRWRRMQGRNTLWLPGTDHAGIATQNVVEKALKKEGKRRQDLGREAFVERVWEWKRQYGGTIVHQQRMLGNSTDWQRERFTFDEGCSKAVTKVFCKLYDEGLVYKGNYIVNWCPRCGTALANDEVEHEPNHGHFWYVKYPVVGSEKGAAGEPYKDYVMVATTRPETLPGDTAVAVNPKDGRYAHLVGKTVVLPLTGREIPVISDDYVDREFGTGIVKITPAHDPNDFLVGKRHGLAEINIMTDDAHMNELAGEKYCGMDRWQCRDAIVADLEAGGYLDHVEDIDNQVGHCYRCHETVESRLSKQWFVKMKPLAEPAIEAVRSGEVRFVPERWSKIYFNWMENIQDWCISRQLWWGHRIPAYSLREEVRSKKEEGRGKKEEGEEVFVAETAEEALEKAKKATGNAALTLDDLERDPDVLDTWFSSWLWPFSTLGWPEKTKDLEYYYPTADLVTAQDIIFFWVARMMMAGLHFMGKPPFRNIVIHGIVRDAQGRKMSKSLGNSLDPLELIDAYSADALRFSLALITSLDCDSRVNKEKFEIGRNFCTKIWNAAKFMEMQEAGAKEEGRSKKEEGRGKKEEVGGLEELGAESLSSDDRHMLWACDAACRKINAILESYRIQDGALAAYDFFWTQICDWYVEYVKDSPNKAVSLAILRDVFWKALRLLHPYMPFVTEEVAHQLGYLKDDETIMLQKFPEGYTDAEKAAWGVTEENYEFVNAKREAITALRALRAEYKVPPATFVKATIATNDPKAKAEEPSLKKAARAESVEFVPAGSDLPMPSKMTKFGTVYLSLEGLVDKAVEAKRIAAELAKVNGFIKSSEAKLANENFVAHAPEAVVAEARRKLAENKEKVAQLEKLARLFA